MSPMWLISVFSTHWRLTQEDYPEFISQPRLYTEVEATLYYQLRLPQNNSNALFIILIMQYVGISICFSTILESLWNDEGSSEESLNVAERKAEINLSPCDNVLWSRSRLLEPLDVCWVFILKSNLYPQCRCHSFNSFLLGKLFCNHLGLYRPHIHEQIKTNGKIGFLPLWR